MMDESYFQQMLTTERPRLVRLCSHLLADSDAAEDATQEVLLAAWRQRGQLRVPHAFGAWLSGIARNVCAQWWRTRKTHWHEQLPWAHPEALVEQPDDFTVDLERHELATLLDQALALLPEDTRAMLVQKYIEEAPNAAIAAQRGLSENVVAVRLHRGRLALQKLLATTLHDQAREWGVVSTASQTRQTTRIWCPFCGEQKLIVELEAQGSGVRFWCPDCRQRTTMQIVWTRQRGLLDGIKKHKPLLSRQLAYCHAHYQRALSERIVPCTICGTPMHVSLRLPARAVSSTYLRECGVHIHCDTCTLTDTTPLQHLVLDLPQTQQFWRTHERMRLGREYAIERDGRAALVTTFESVTTAARLVVLTDAETLAVRSITHER